MRSCKLTVTGGKEASDSKAHEKRRGDQNRAEEKEDRSEEAEADNGERQRQTRESEKEAASREEGGDGEGLELGGAPVREDALHALGYLAGHRTVLPAVCHCSGSVKSR